MHLTICLDGVSYRVVDNLWHRLQMRHRFTCKPVILTSQFPTNTNIALAKSLGFVSDSYEPEKFFDPEKNRVVSPGLRQVLCEFGLSNPETNYFRNHFEFTTSILGYGVSFFFPDYFVRRDLSVVAKNGRERLFFYSAVTDSIGHSHGDPALERVILQLDEVVSGLPEDMRLTIFSDHGMSRQTRTNLTHFDLETALRNFGYNPSRKIRNEKDIVINCVGLLSAIPLHCNPSQRQRLAEMLASQPEVLFSIARTGDNKDSELVVYGKHGRAVMQENGDSLVYSTRGKDPLNQGQYSGGRGAYYKLSCDSEYPYAIPRILDAFNNVRFPADIILNLAFGYQHGPRAVNLLYGQLKSFVSTHGSLDRDSTNAFLLTNEPGLTKHTLEKEGSSYMRITDLDLVKLKQES